MLEVGRARRSRAKGLPLIWLQRSKFNTDMSLLDCICCSKHKLRTAVIWDTHTDVIVCSLTYSELISNAYEISTYLQQNVQYPAENHIGLKSNPICIYGSNCPEVLSALLGIMALPGSFMPIDLAQPSAQKEHLLRKCGVGLVIVQLSLLQVYMSMCEEQCILTNSSYSLLQIDV